MPRLAARTIVALATLAAASLLAARLSAEEPAHRQATRTLPPSMAVESPLNDRAPTAIDVEQHAAEQPPLALSPSRGGSEPRAPQGASLPRSSRASNIFTGLVGLAIVLGLFLVTAWVMKKAMPQSAELLPRDVVEVLGRTPLPFRQQAHLLRVGRKLVLVSFSSGMAEPLVEIDDPVEIDRLVGRCRESQPASATAVFRNVLAQMSREPAVAEPIESDRSSSAARSSAKRRWITTGEGDDDAGA